MGHLLLQLFEFKSLWLLKFSERKEESKLKSGRSSEQFWELILIFYQPCFLNRMIDPETPNLAPEPQDPAEVQRWLQIAIFGAFYPNYFVR